MHKPKSSEVIVRYLTDRFYLTQSVKTPADGYETDILRLGVGYQFTKLKKEVKGPRSEFGDKEF